MPEVFSSGSTMMSLEHNIDDLNLDFSDRNWEARPRNRNFIFEFKLHESDSDSGGESEGSVVEDVDLDDEYFFDNKIDFSHYIPKQPPKQESSETKIVTESIKENEKVTKDKEGVEESNVTCSKVLNGDISHIQENESERTVDKLTEGVESCSITEARRNDREEIRKKLAMGGEDGLDDDDDEDDEITYKKPNIQSRLHSGLQICFMNESPGDTDNEGLSPRQHEIHDNAKLMKKVSNLVDSDNNLSSVTDLNNPTPPDIAKQSSSPPRLKAKDDNAKSEDFHTRQEKLQNEAKLALAQAGSMAHMQLEIEKQLKKKSPMAEMVGIPGLGEKHRKKLSIRQLQQMNLASIQVLYNDLQTQIESLNEELVHLLMERDELHMAQDSMLVDIEDLTRRAEELAERANRTGGNKGSKPSVKGKLPSR